MLLQCSWDKESYQNYGYYVIWIQNNEGSHFPPPAVSRETLRMLRMPKPCMGFRRGDTSTKSSWAKQKALRSTRAADSLSCPSTLHGPGWSEGSEQ